VAAAFNRHAGTAAESFPWAWKNGGKKPALPMDPKMVERTPHPGPLPIGSADSADAEREKGSQRLGDALSLVIQGFNARNFLRENFSLWVKDRMRGKSVRNDAAAQELNSQAQVMKRSVAELLQFVGGKHESVLSQPTSFSQATRPVHAVKPIAIRPGATNGHSPLFPKTSRKSEIPLETAFQDF